MKTIFSSLAVIIGTIIGAGFASGKEIINFFNVYENQGLIGIIISSIIFGLVVTLTIFTIKKCDIKNYKELVNNNKGMPIILQIFSLVCFCIMISGVGAFFEEQLNINFWIGTAFASAVSYVMFLNKFKGIETFSLILVPLIIIGILVIGFSNYNGLEIAKTNDIQTSQNGNFILSAILYASYNSLILIPILINLRKYNFEKKRIFILGALVTLILGYLMFLIYKINNLFYPEITAVELPNMMLASLLSKEIKVVYGIVMLCAIFTTAFSCGFSFLEMRKKENYEKNALVICVIAFLCARFGFSNMINICFPFFGYFGIYQIILIFRRYMRSKKWRKINLFLYVLL